ncbi:MAG: dockerin type I repeat-containing protein [Oscillospiraceae bacterium]|nr:dockerin type I repeat-containing protein [Oscillospiraceae bacterium]
MSKKLVALYSSLVMGITCMNGLITTNAWLSDEKYAEYYPVYDGVVYKKYQDGMLEDLGSTQGGSVDRSESFLEIAQHENPSVKIAVQINAYSKGADEKELTAEGERLSENGIQVVSYEGKVVTYDNPKEEWYAYSNGADVYFAIMTLEQAENFPASQDILYQLYVQRLPEGLQPDSDKKETVLAHDVNGDGDIDIMDVITVNKAILGKELLTEEQNIAADVDKNNKVDSNDALLLMKYIVGIITDFNA